MKEYKFRAKDYGGDEVFVDLKDCWSGGQEVLDMIDLKTMEQYTGLDDINGKKIYEGDIVECNYDDYHDPFGNNYSHPGRKETLTIEMDDFSDFIELPLGSTEIIGNIREEKLTYIEKIKQELQKHYEFEEEYIGLLDGYALLVLTKGAKCTNENVHDAWSLWQNKIDEEHKSLIPYNELAREVQVLDKEYKDIIIKVSNQLK